MIPPGPVPLLICSSGDNPLQFAGLNALYVKSKSVHFVITMVAHDLKSLNGVASGMKYILIHS